jgi:monovalent cation/proton antiporter MnhG/PhaG subunit
VAKAVSLGISLILLGAWLVLGAEEAGLKLGLAIGFQLATIPVASHLLSRAAYRGGLARDRAGERKGREGR